MYTLILCVCLHFLAKIQVYCTVLKKIFSFAFSVSCKHSQTLPIHTHLTPSHTHPTHTLTHTHTHTHPHRAEVSSEDDLSPDTDSDSMEVDITPTREMSEAFTPVRGASNHDNKGGDKSIGSALVPEVQPHFAVS